MKTTCPSCGHTQDAERAGKLVLCAGCGQNFVASPAGAAPAPIAGLNAAEDEELVLHANEESESEMAPPGAADPATLKFCPSCGAPWRKNAPECKKCHFVARLGAVLKPKGKGGMGFKFDVQQMWLWVALAAAAYGLYYTFTHFNQFRAWFNQIFN